MTAERDARLTRDEARKAAVVFAQVYDDAVTANRVVASPGQAAIRADVLAAVDAMTARLEKLREVIRRAAVVERQRAQLIRRSCVHCLKRHHAVCIGQMGGLCECAVGGHDELLAAPALPDEIPEHLREA